MSKRKPPTVRHDATLVEKLLKTVANHTIITPIKEQFLRRFYLSFPEHIGMQLTDDDQILLGETAWKAVEDMMISLQSHFQAQGDEEDEENETDKEREFFTLPRRRR